MRIYPSSIPRRLGAFAIDLSILGCITFGISLIMIRLDGLNVPEWLEVTSIVLLLLFYLFCIPLSETLLHGQTIGKKVLNIRVVRSNGAPASGVHCMQRYLLYTFDYLLTFGFGALISIMITKKRQRLGDLVADTVVVNCAPQNKIDINEAYNDLNEDEKQVFAKLSMQEFLYDENEPLSLANSYRSVECSIAHMRTYKGHPSLIAWMEAFLSSLHISIYRKQSYTLSEFLIYTLRSVPRAVYECRREIIAALAISLLALGIGIYSQYADPESFRNFFGSYYYETTVENIASGKPMGIYSSESTWYMFYHIFFNNLIVTLRLYAYGLIAILGPVVMLLHNFVSFGIFDAFFTQQGLLSHTLITPNQHGVLELSSIIITAGAALKLGTGWLFPGNLSRYKAFVRSARHSLLVMLSTLPMILIAAIIESFVTRHTDWPLSVRLGIIVASLLFIITYYVMLPIIARRH